MILLGINEGMNSSVVVLRDGEIIFALQEERMNKIKEYAGFPEQALDFTMQYLGISNRDVDAVCLSNMGNPSLSREDYNDRYDLCADRPRKSGLLVRAMRALRRRIYKQGRHVKFAEEYLAEHGFASTPTHRFNHHFLHAASAYYGMRSNATDPHLVMTLDGGGDGDCAHIYVVRDGEFEQIAKTSQGNSIGNLYSAMTHYMGMKPHEHEYKLMGLAAYSKKDYCLPVIDKLRGYLDIDPDNPLCLKRKISEPTSCIGYRLARDFARERFDNLAGGMQFFTEELMVQLVKNAVRETGIKKVVVAGGVFMNVKANKIISELPEIEYFNVMPSCGDETLPFGAVWHMYATANPDKASSMGLKTFCLGPKADFDMEEARGLHVNSGLKFDKLENPAEEIAKLMNDGQIVARCVGPMEFGARALGNRSLLADPSRHSIVPYINNIIKNRDFWMPFAPAIMHDDAETYIKVPNSLSSRLSPFMMHTFNTTECRGDIVCGIHAYDMTARAQTVDPVSNPEFYQVLENYKKLRGNGVSLNTSFNLHGLPIVMGTIDAIHVLLNSGLKYLVVEDTLITKE